jgi:2-polyprenyl-3-methyl-5-hydroxy-6-metoxy-1,4-benzoquinol methylase
MGQPPHVLPWHPNWPDFNTVLRELAPFFADRSQRLLILSNEPTAFTLALADNGERVHRMRCVPFMKSHAERYLPLHEKFDLCLLELPETDLRYGDTLIDRIMPLMKNGGSIVVFVTNRRIVDDSGEFGQSMAFHTVRLIRSGVVPTEIHFVPANMARRTARRGMFNLRVLMSRQPWFSVPLALMGGGALLGLSFIGNLDALRTTRRVSTRGYKSSLVMRLAVDAPRIAEVGTAHPQLDGARVLKSRGQALTEATGAPAYGSATETREPQYNRCIELRDTMGLTSLGLMTNQIWYDDPRRLTFLLARYKFVAKMLSGCKNVGEVGCGDAFGTRVVLQEVPDVTVYDFDPLFIEDIRARQDERWPLKAEVHDIVASSLPRKHNALFSLDVIEHIAPADEHAFLSHLCDSLDDGGLLMIGTPSLESQPYASPPSKAGHINCKTSKELKALLEKYFAHVFMFSMNDEVVHTGFSPMAHYLFALCTMPKVEVGDLKRTVSPKFEICEVPAAPGFFVRVTHPNSEPQRVDGFGTVAEAAQWISNQAQDWLRAGRPASY